MRGSALSIGGYFTEMLDPSMNWDDVAEMVRHWNGQFCLKGVMSPADAGRARAGRGLQLGQSGEHTLTESFTARDPKPTFSS